MDTPEGVFLWLLGFPPDQIRRPSPCHDLFNGIIADREVSKESKELVGERCR